MTFRHVRVHYLLTRRYRGTLNSCISSFDHDFVFPLRVSVTLVIPYRRNTMRTDGVIDFGLDTVTAYSGR